MGVVKERGEFPWVDYQTDTVWDYAGAILFSQQ